MSGKVGRRLADGKVVLQMKNKSEFALDPQCNVVVGKCGTCSQLRSSIIAPKVSLSWKQCRDYCSARKTIGSFQVTLSMGRIFNICDGVLQQSLIKLKYYSII